MMLRRISLNAVPARRLQPLLRWPKSIFKKSLLKQILTNHLHLRGTACKTLLQNFTGVSQVFARADAATGPVSGATPDCPLLRSHISHRVNPLASSKNGMVP
jgi:hypothetical protein